MDEMLALAEGHESCFLFKQVFLNRMPPDLQVQLATQNFTNAHEFSLVADQLWWAKVSSEHALVGIDSVAINRDRPTALCFFHAKFGSRAYRCRMACSFTGKDQRGRQPGMTVRAITERETARSVTSSGGDRP